MVVLFSEKTQTLYTLSNDWMVASCGPSSCVSSHSTIGRPNSIIYARMFVAKISRGSATFAD